MDAQQIGRLEKDKFLDALKKLRLEKFAGQLEDFGYSTLSECQEITDEELKDLGIIQEAGTRAIIPTLTHLFVK